MTNPQITNSMQVLQQATLTSDVIRHSGAGKAYQSVAQTTAIAIQDAADQLRNMNTISATATGVAISQMLATGEVDKFQSILVQIESVLTQSNQNFLCVGQNSSEILRQFPDGDS